jgi:hypothetical protein
MHNYAGNPASYPANVGLVDDADLNPATAAALVVASENLADRTAYLHANSILSTGGTMSGTLSVSGEVDFLNGSFLVLEAGSEAIVEGGASVIYANAASWILQAGAVGQIQAGAGVGVFGAAGIVGLVPSAIQSQSPGAIDSLVPGGIRLSGGSTDNVAFNPPRTKVLAQPMVLGASGLAPNWTAGYQLVGSAPGTLDQQLLWLPLTHDGATLATVTILFAVFDSHAGGPPGAPPTLNIVRIDLQSSGVSTPVQVSLGGGAQAFATGGTGATWHNGGNLKTQVYTCSVNNVINNSRYAYQALLVDESGANAAALNSYFGFLLNHTQIADARAPY